ncbi:Rieske domain-containing protein [Xylariales sp. AK1849]|nr:Rieske domain-containing protein [Xylariales sp. AK1849]
MMSNRRSDAWFSVGLTSSFPNITEADNGTVSDMRFCDEDLVPGCRVFQAPRTDDSQFAEVDHSEVTEAVSAPRDLKDQVLVFQYRGKFHAVNNQCPHSSFPLSNGTPFDIEDFGVVLSAGITCPKHGWSFDLFSGQADRGNYKLSVWEVQLRPIPRETGIKLGEGEQAREIWVRKKQRIG